MNNSIFVSDLICYPVKSCGGISLPSARIGPMGIVYDRQWMVVSENGIFVAQRGNAQLGAVGVKSMCLVHVELGNRFLVLRAPNMPVLMLPKKGCAGKEINVQVWQSQCIGIDQGEEAANWFSDYLSREVPGKYRLVRMPDTAKRHTQKGNSLVGYADGYPLLMTSQTGLNFINMMTDNPIPMNRFRPNIIVKGLQVIINEDGVLFEEQDLKRFEIGTVEFENVKPCARCPITTINQQTGERGEFPLNVLAKVAKTPSGVIFGINVNHLNTGTIRIGDRLILQG